MARAKIAQDRVSLLRLLEYMLLKAPDEFGLVAEDGWYTLKEVFQALAEEGRGVRESQIQELNHLALAEGRRPPLALEGNRLLFLTGRPPEPEPVSDPPAWLHAACRQRAYDFVQEKGLVPTSGRYVVLAAEPEMALRLGRRREKDTLLIKVKAQEAARAGIKFLRLGENLYLCPEVPPEHVELPLRPREAEEKESPRPKPEKDRVARPEEFSPGSFLMTPEKGPRDKDRSRKDKKDWQKSRREDRRRKREDF